MRFQRADLLGILIATLAPVGLFVLLLASYDLWHHHGTPLLGGLAANIAIGAGLIGAFSRFFRHLDALGGLLIVLILTVTLVLILQATGFDDTVWSTLFKLAGVGVFGLINLVIVWDVLSFGLNPILQRRDDRLAQQNAEA